MLEVELDIPDRAELVIHQQAVLLEGSDIQQQNEPILDIKLVMYFFS